MGMEPARRLDEDRPRHGDHPVIWAISIGIPLACALIALAPGVPRAAVRWLPAFAGIPAIAAAILSPPPAELDAVLLGVHLGPGEYAGALLLPTALVWTAAGLFSWRLMVKDERSARFAFYFLATMAGNIGLLVARDVPTFYACFALMTFCAYGLIVHDRTGEAMRAGRVYLIMALAGEAALLVSLLLAVNAAGSTLVEGLSAHVAASPDRDLIILAAGIGFGVKAGAFLLHFWLPLAHPVAPAPASAVLSGCMIKAGLVGWLHLLPLGIVDLPAWGLTFTVFGAVALWFGVLAGLGEPRPKTILAYSSISQMGLMTLTVGLGLLHAEGWARLEPVLLLLVMNHALAKGMLFMAAGTAPATGKSIWQRRLLLGLASIPVLALAGLPWTGGAAAKAMLKKGLPPAELFWPLPLDIVLLLSSTGTMLLLTHFLLRSRDTFTDEERRPQPMLWLPWIALLPFLALAYDWIGRLSGIVADLPPARLIDHLSAAWPVLLGLFLAWPFRRLCRECVLPALMPWSRVNDHATMAMDSVLSATDRIRPMDSAVGRAVKTRYVRWFIPEVADPDMLLRIEKRFLTWSSMALVFLLALALFLFLSYMEVFRQ
jgi:hydrogenase-4 component B